MYLFIIISAVKKIIMYLHKFVTAYYRSPAKVRLCGI